MKNLDAPLERDYDDYRLRAGSLCYGKMEPLTSQLQRQYLELCIERVLSSDSSNLSLRHLSNTWHHWSQTWWSLLCLGLFIGIFDGLFGTQDQVQNMDVVDTRMRTIPLPLFGLEWSRPSSGMVLLYPMATTNGNRSCGSLFVACKVEGRCLCVCVMLGTGKIDAGKIDAGKITHTDNRDCMCLGSDGRKKNEFSYNETSYT